MSAHLQRKLGFTLIEIIISILILVIVASVGLFSLNTLNRRQIINQSARKIAQELRFAQNLAQTNRKHVDIPGQTCTQLVGYRVNRSGQTFQIFVVCSNGEYPYNDSNGMFTTPLNVSGGFTSVLFKVLNGGIVFSPTANDRTLELSLFNQGVVVEVSPGGEIVVRQP